MPKPALAGFKFKLKQPKGFTMPWSNQGSTSLTSAARAINHALSHAVFPAHVYLRRSERAVRGMFISRTIAAVIIFFMTLVVLTAVQKGCGVAAQRRPAAFRSSVSLDGVSVSVNGSALLSDGTPPSEQAAMNLIHRAASHLPVCPSGRLAPGGSLTVVLAVDARSSARIAALDTPPTTNKSAVRRGAARNRAAVGKAAPSLLPRAIVSQLVRASTAVADGGRLPPMLLQAIRLHLRRKNATTVEPLPTAELVPPDDSSLLPDFLWLVMKGMEVIVIILVLAVITVANANAHATVEKDTSLISGRSVARRKRGGGKESRVRSTTKVYATPCSPRHASPHPWAACPAVESYLHIETRRTDVLLYDPPLALPRQVKVPRQCGHTHFLSSTMLVLCLLCGLVKAQNCCGVGSVSTFAGSGSAGAVDAIGTFATFYEPHDLALSNDSTILYVADFLNHKIRAVVVATGAVSTIAGSGSVGAVDATGTSASFNRPVGLALLRDDTILYVSDHDNHKIRAVNVATGAVSTIALCWLRVGRRGRRHWHLRELQPPGRPGPLERRHDPLRIGSRQP